MGGLEIILDDFAAHGVGGTFPLEGGPGGGGVEVVRVSALEVSEAPWAGVASLRVRLAACTSLSRGGSWAQKKRRPPDEPKLKV